ncbi:hypothetical protein [Rubrivirga sp.]|uniref:hypothetical protein n=1 Tax=Rubrivirga sp. TaxID=1885344 RepID=UPI003B515EF7
MPAARLLAVALLALLVGLPASAQAPRLSPSAPRVLFRVADSVKTDGGQRELVTRTVTYDPAAGLYTDRTTGADGRVLSESVERTSVIGPTPAEAAAARRLVASHPEIAPLIEAAGGTVHVEGGFPLVREPGHPCGPGGRCVLIDVFETSADRLPRPGGATARRLRYVVVDLRALRVLDADADPAGDGNLANPAARRRSRQ